MEWLIIWKAPFIVKFRAHQSPGFAFRLCWASEAVNEATMTSISVSIPIFYWLREWECFVLTWVNLNNL